MCTPRGLNTRKRYYIPARGLSARIRYVILTAMRKLTLKDVRLTDGGTEARAAPLRFFGVRSLTSEVLKRGADWSAIARHVNARRKAELASWEDIVAGRQIRASAVPAHERARLERRFASRQWVSVNCITFTCKTCDEDAVHLNYARGGAAPSYCSPACVPSPPSRAKRRQERVCAQCGKSFTPKRRDARTCSVACRVALHRAAA